MAQQITISGLTYEELRELKAIIGELMFEIEQGWEEE